MTWKALRHVQRTVVHGHWPWLCTVAYHKGTIFFIAANFDTLPRAQKLGFFHEVFLQEHPYLNNICAKFQGQKIHQKKDIESLPTCVVVDFHCYQLCHLLKD